MKPAIRRIGSMRIARVMAAVVSVGIICILYCVRDNPLDTKGNAYLPGSPPEARFAKDTIFSFIKDTIPIEVRFRDTVAIGGRTPRVTTLYFNWKDGNEKADSMPAPDKQDTVIRKVFDRPLNGQALVWAKDNDAESSDPPGAVRLVIDEGKPRITGITATDTAKAGDTVSITVTAKDTNGTISRYIWRVDKNADDTTGGNVYETAFPADSHKVIVRVVDDDGVSSDPDSIQFFVGKLIDTTKPAVAFQSPANGSIHNKYRISAYISTKDSSGVGTVLINKSIAARQVGGSPTSALWFADSIFLSLGSNTITAQAYDNSSELNIGETSITVKCDPSAFVENPPEIIFRSPLPGDIIKGLSYHLAIVVNVIDRSGMGIAYVICANDTMVKDSNALTYTSDVPVSIGINSFVIKAGDKTGTETKDTLIFTYQKQEGKDITPPNILFESPKPNQQIDATTFPVVVRVSDDSGVDSVLIDGKPARPDTSTPSNWTRDVTLRHGYDTIRVNAVDQSDNHNRRLDSIIVVQNSPPRFVPDSSVMDKLVVQGKPATIPIYVVDPDKNALTCAFLDPKVPGVSLTKISDTCFQISNFAPGDTGITIFKVQATDTYKGSATVTIIAHIISGEKPVFTTTDNSDTVIAKTLYTKHLQAMDPNQKKLAYSLGTAPAGAGIDSATGTVSWATTLPDTGKKVFRAIVSNGAESDTFDWTVIVTAPNLPPKLQKPGDTTISEEQPLRIALVASDPNGDSLAYSFASTFPAGAKIEKNLFSWTPSGTQAGPYTIQCKVTEIGTTPALWDTASAKILVVDITKPKFNAHAPFDTVYVGRLFKDTLSATDAGKDTLSFGKVSGPGGLTVNKSGIVSWTPQPADANGSFIVKASVTDNGGNFDTLSWTIRVLPSVTVPKWPRIIDVEGFSQDTGFSVVKLRLADDLIDGFAIGGTARLPGGGLRGYFIKTNDTGAVVLKKLYGGPTVQQRVVSMLKTHDKGFLLCGSEYPDNTKERCLLIKTRFPDADTAWTIRLSSQKIEESDSRGFWVQADPLGGYIVCGESLRRSSATIETRVFLAKVSYSGVMEWYNVYLLPAGSGSVKYLTSGARCVLPVSSPRGYIICGHISTETKHSTYIIKTDSIGTLKWSQRYDDINSRIGLSIAEAAGNNGFFIGEMRKPSLTTAAGNGWVFKIDAAGAISWSTLLPGKGTGAIRSVRSTADGGCIAAGYSNFQSSDNTDAALLKLSVGGAIQWTKYFDAGGDDAAMDVSTLSDEGYIFTGFTQGNGTTPNTDIYLVKADKNGNIPPR